MLWVAVLLLPLLSVLLAFMDRVEERLLAPVSARRRHAGRRRHLRLIPGGATGAKPGAASDGASGAVTDAATQADEGRAA
ncbi:hypothetical protein GCM10010269_52300 [Streptomyces humidus]|uniref:Uncharacterized protein n=1 Tax=Streptomyces humidus TaxID=52259 RepID=A0A918G0H9_9ACTN|nr:hypothetical protein [Streptomyces humidus]GGS06914.1 hypothetical protein GCM10010269_52300 [Streptomyces humidus]